MTALTETTPKRRFQILALDGGGIKGIFSAAFLAALEDDLKTRITDHFDLIAGTSTGGLIAIALGLGLSPREIVRFYMKHGPAIFPGAKRSHLNWRLEPASGSVCLERARTG